MYRSTIGINKNQKFGVEIEFGNANIVTVYDKLFQKMIPVTYQLHHKMTRPIYDTWYVDTDTTVSIIDNGKIRGGELSSRILSDNKCTWKEIKEICSILQESNAIPDYNTSTHVTVDTSSFYLEKDFIETLAKIIAVYEVELDIFYMGDKYLKRNTKERFAADLSLRLLDIIDSTDFKRDDILYQLARKKCFTVRDGVSFHKLKKKGLIEFRYPNGTINEKTIQNYINFTLKLLTAIQNNKFDLEELTYQISELKSNYLNLYRTLGYIGNTSKFMDLVTNISTSSLDEEDFLNQYQKVITNKKI